MTTKHLPIDRLAPAAEAIALAGETIRAGGLVAFPTETVYGLGANAWDTQAVARIFHAKGRPSTDPLIVHIADMEQLSQVARAIPASARELCRRFWPGALTLVLPKANAIPANLTAGLDTVAVRMPDHAVALALLRNAGVPIAAPSANLFSRPSPTSAQHVLEDLAGHVDIVLDAGSTTIGLESTIVSLVDNPPRLLRPGGISLESLREIVPDLRYEPQYIAEDGEAAPAPGTMLKHYAPRARIMLFQGADDAAVHAAMRREIARQDNVGLLVTMTMPRLLAISMSALSVWAVMPTKRRLAYSPPCALSIKRVWMSSSRGRRTDREWAWLFGIGSFARRSVR